MLSVYILCNGLAHFGISLGRCITVKSHRIFFLDQVSQHLFH